MLKRGDRDGNAPLYEWQADGIKVQLSDSDTEEYLRAGCKFAGRCPQAMEVCQKVAPKDGEVEGALMKCHLFGEK